MGEPTYESYSAQLAKLASLRQDWLAAKRQGDSAACAVVEVQGKQVRAEVESARATLIAERVLDENGMRNYYALPDDHVETCWKCNGTGTYQYGGAVVNGKYTGKTGKCYPCGGKGKCTKSDLIRTDVYYRKHYNPGI